MRDDMDYLQFWQLREPPFEAVSNTAFFYESNAHSEGIARLLYVVADQGMGIGALTGEIGSGKTMILNVLRERIPRDMYQTVHITTASFAFEHLLQEIIAQVEGDDLYTESGNDGKYPLLKRLERCVEERVTVLDKHLLVMLDESQLLEPGCLEELKCLTNLNRPGRSVLTIILAGQPELRRTLRSMPQVYQRMGMVYHLSHLERSEVPDYVRHRLAVSGASRLDIFEPDCMDLLYQFSHGCPRQINRVCKLAVDRACLLEQHKVNRDMVQRIVDDIRRQFG